MLELTPMKWELSRRALRSMLQRAWAVRLHTVLEAGGGVRNCAGTYDAVDAVGSPLGRIGTTEVVAVRLWLHPLLGRVQSRD
jgi:hypothetical protein